MSLLLAYVKDLGKMFPRRKFPRGGALNNTQS